MAAAGAAGSLKLLPPLQAAATNAQTHSEEAEALLGENRSSEYLRRARQDALLPKAPEFAESARSGALRISPMPAPQRVKRKLVPRRGFCSLAPGNGRPDCGA